MISFGIILATLTVVSAVLSPAEIDYKRNALIGQLEPMVKNIPTVLSNLDAAIEMAPGIHDQLVKVNVGASDAKDQLKKIYAPLKEKIKNSMRAFGESFPEDIPSWTASELQHDMVTTINHALESYDAFRAHLTAVQQKAPAMIAKLRALNPSDPDAEEKFDKITAEKMA